MIDSGILGTHQLLQDDSLRWTGDCVNGGNDCWGTGAAPNGAGALPYNTEDACDHGTAATSIIRGSGRLGAELRGITRITTDSWRVFETVNGGCTAAASDLTRAVQKAIDSFDSLIVFEWESHNGPASAESTAADNAFETGAVVISAVGNGACATDGQGDGVWATPDGNCRAPVIGVEPDWRTAGSPGDARKVIAVGARDISGDCPDNPARGAARDGICAYSGRGSVDQELSVPARPDLRYKPHILGYTNVEAASSTGNDDTWAWPGFSGAGATPTVAALGMLYYNWMQSAVPSNFRFNCPTQRSLSSPTGVTRQVCPGHVYAHLLNSAENVTQDEGAGWNGTTGAAAELNIEGAGLPVALTNGWAGWGEWAVSRTQTANIPLNIPANACNLSATIWWPEERANAHSNLDLRITGPVGVAGALANSRPSVWERQSFPGPIAPGGWLISVVGTDVPISSQPFYFAWSFNTGAGCP